MPTTNIQNTPLMTGRRPKPQPQVHEIREIRYIPMPTQGSSLPKNSYKDILYGLAREAALSLVVNAGRYALEGAFASFTRPAIKEEADLQQENTTLKEEVGKLSKQNKELTDEVTTLREQLDKNNKTLALIAERLEQLRPATLASEQEPSTRVPSEVGSIIIRPGSLPHSPAASETEVEIMPEVQGEAVYGEEEKESDNYWQTAVGSRARSESNHSQEFVRVEQGSIRSVSSGSARSVAF